MVVGGPDVTPGPHIYARADFRVLGEAEGILGRFVVPWETGERHGIFEAVKLKADVTTTPMPRFDLVNFRDATNLNAQFARGCPFTCEFSDIIELYGRNPRTKATAQMLDELDALFNVGYRGHVDLVDDNSVGTQRALTLGVSVVVLAHGLARLRAGKI